MCLVTINATVRCLNKFEKNCATSGEREENVHNVNLVYVLPPSQKKCEKAIFSSPKTSVTKCRIPTKTL